MTLKPGEIDKKETDWFRIISFIIGLCGLILGIINTLSK